MEGLTSDVESTNIMSIEPTARVRLANDVLMQKVGDDAANYAKAPFSMLRALSFATVIARPAQRDDILPGFESQFLN